jgi:hypothetical protein
MNIIFEGLYKLISAIYKCANGFKLACLVQKFLFASLKALIYSKKFSEGHIFPFQLSFNLTGQFSPV